MTNPSFDAARDAVTRTVREHWKLFLIEGIILVILGLFAVTLPLLAGLAVTILFGWLFLISGAVGLVTTFAMRQAPGFWWSLISAVLGIVVGVLLLVQPGVGLVSLTYVLTAFFIADGILVIILAIAHRRELSGKWEWMMVNGIIDLILAGIIIAGFPGTLVWAFGLLVGIDMLFAGGSLIAMALQARKGADK